MVPTDAQIEAFMKDANLMALPTTTATKLREEDISNPADLLEFETKSMFQIANNLCRSGGSIVDLNDATTTILTSTLCIWSQVPTVT